MISIDGGLDAPADSFLFKDGEPESYQHVRTVKSFHE
jgi:hypothetical protein